MIHLYGFEKKPFQLPKYVSPLLFAYEVIRKNIVVNELHFVSKKKGALFNYPYAIPPLIAKTKNDIDILEREMLSFEFLQDNIWHYDPLEII